MKRALILLITLFSLLFAACGSAASDSSKSENTPAGKESGTSAGSLAESTASTTETAESTASTTETAESTASTTETAENAESTAESAAPAEDTTAASVSDITISDVDAGLSVVLTEIMDQVHSGEAGSSLKSAQAAADALDFALGTDLDAEMIAAMTYAYYDSLHEAAKEEFPEQLQLLGETLETLRTAEGEALLTDAGISDSSYPWTDEAFERAEALAHACRN